MVTAMVPSAFALLYPRAAQSLELVLRITNFGQTSPTNKEDTICSDAVNMRNYRAHFILPILVNSEQSLDHHPHEKTNLIHSLGNEQNQAGVWTNLEYQTSSTFFAPKKNNHPRNEIAIGHELLRGLGRMNGGRDFTKEAWRWKPDKSENLMWHYYGWPKWDPHDFGQNQIAPTWKNWK